MRLETDVIVALIGAVATLIGILIQNHFHNKKTMEQSNQNAAVIEYRIKELEKKQDKHNALIDRMYNIEKTVTILDERLKDLEDNKK